MFVVAFFVTLTVILCTPLIWWYLTLAKYSSLKKVPGPPPLPVIGNSNVIGKTTVDLLHSFMNLQDKYGTVVKVWLGPRLHLLITKPEMVEFFLNSTVHLNKSDGYDLFKPWLGDGLLVSTGSKWKTRRKLITPTFHFKILENFLETSFNKQINILLDVLLKEASQTDKSIEIHSLINLCSLDIICETAFGTELNAQAKCNPKYVEAVTGFLEIFTLRFFSAWLRHPLIFRLSDKYAKYMEYLKILHDFTNTIIKRRKEEFKLLQDNAKISEEGIKRRAALLDMLLEVSDNGKNLTDEDIREEVDTFMFEGHDTTTTSICFVLYAIAQNPDVQKKIYDELVSVLGPDCKKEITFSDIQELKYLDVVIKEAHRLYPPVPLIERSLEEDCTIDGLTIPKNTNISIFLYGMNYNKDVYPEPHVFDPDRFLPEKQGERHTFAYVPFSAGPRNCIGQKFALLELKTTIAKLLRCFEISPDPKNPPQVGMCSVLKSRNGIHMFLKKKN
ncbi:cytochrome P450 4BR3 [Tribolium castaneum]|uniref:Cytochrome P450 4BR3 n=1 Tax=Tribolium castaneum TaxID=7070 RepID=D6WFN8_TRICA|nr:PREDICTED: cytochrome P450 4d2 [Tribolium castaneum]EFA01323.1 cytochrome P450 4BR3 [Tribolium castaneum]|eukprot:XP_967724.1 PREDICTED: cytochrome P450 4d2 [Tribolium castaneum]